MKLSYARLTLCGDPICLSSSTVLQASMWWKLGVLHMIKSYLKPDKRHKTDIKDIWLRISNQKMRKNYNLIGRLLYNLIWFTDNRQWPTCLGHPVWTRVPGKHTSWNASVNQWGIGSISRHFQRPAPLTEVTALAEYGQISPTSTCCVASRHVTTRYPAHAFGIGKSGDARLCRDVTGRVEFELMFCNKRCVETFQT